jgi:hypothetical protein
VRSRSEMRSNRRFSFLLFGVSSLSHVSFARRMTHGDNFTPKMPSRARSGEERRIRYRITVDYLETTGTTWFLFSFWAH